MKFTRSLITSEIRNNHKQFLIVNQPTDHQQVEYLRTQFSTLRIAHIFQIFEFLNNREAGFQNQFQNIFSQIRNQAKEQMSIQTTQTRNQVPVQNPGGGNP